MSAMEVADDAADGPAAAGQPGPWKVDPKFRTRDNSPSGREQKSACWNVMKRLSLDHPLATQYSHICTHPEGATPLKLFKPKDKDSWTTTHAIKHMATLYVLEKALVVRELRNH